MEAPAELYREPHWYALRTRGRAEKAVARRLEERGFTSYCPLIERERQWADRRTRVLFPLFPSYVFARFTLTDLGEVLGVPGVTTVVRTAGVPTVVRPEELDSVRLLETGIGETGEEPHPADYLEVGEPVRVEEGPFAGMTGVLTEERGRSRVLVRLSAIRQAVGIEVDREVLSPDPAAS